MPLDSPRPILSTPKVADTTGFPARSLPSSTSAHIVFIVALLLLGLAPVTVEGPQHLRQSFRPVDLQPQPDDAPALPEMQSSSASASSPASASSRSAPGRNGPSSASSMPLIHQRRQHIISNTPDATNPVQTILQPDIPNPPRLTKTLPVPSMVRMAPMKQRAPTLTAPTLTAIVKPAAPPTPTPAPQPTLPKIRPANVDTVPLTSATEAVDSPRIPAYATTGRTFQPPKQPTPPPAATKPSAPRLAANTAPSPPSTATPAGGTDARNLLVVNALEVQSTLTEHDIPAAEIHGRFEVTASPSLPEAPTTGGSSSSAGVNGSGVATSGNGAGKGNSAKSSTGAGTGGTHGNGAGTGTSNVAGAGAGHGTGLGNGTGSGTGHAANAGMGNGTGNGPAGGNGSAPFSGMTIVGGSSGNGGGLRSEPASGNVNPNDPRGSYGLTILSNGGSGGAVRDYGVFTGGPVYTVYLDLSKLGSKARWSFQYSASRDDRIAHPGVPLTPPLPQDERLPQLPPALVAANIGRLVVIQANLKPDGKLEAFHVLESPDQRLNEGIITSLTHWYFDPAAMGTDKIAVKVLFGIPIATAMADNGVSQQADQHTPTDAALRSPAQ